jgi:hypothetical protein
MCAISRLVPVLGLLVVLLAAAPAARAHSTSPNNWLSSSPGTELRYHEKGGFHYDFGAGWHGFVQPTGAYQSLASTFALRATLGWNFNWLFGLEMEYTATFFRVRDNAFGDLPNVTLSTPSLNARFRLVRPTSRKVWIPYLLGGIGMNILSGESREQTACGTSASGKERTIAFGGALRVGLGVDAYLLRGIIRLGARAMYTHDLMSRIACSPETPCGRAGGGDLHRLNGVQVDFSFGAQLPW